MSVSLKSVTTKQIEDAIAKSLAELTGNECDISISEIQFDSNPVASLTGRDEVVLSLKASLGKTYGSSGSI